jgi:histidine triad (HIT) family protein
MVDCIFCRIVGHDSPASYVYEDEDVVAFLDINPLTEGHTLVIPKQHIVNIFDAEDQVMGKTMAVARRVSHAMKEALGAQGVNILISNGAPADQTVFHFHIHVVPRRTGDGLRLNEWWLTKVRSSKREGLDSLAAKLKSEIAERK